LPQGKGESKAELQSAALRAEVKALDAARATLASGNAQGTLALLEGYDRSYPRGLLKLEAEVVRIDALARSGQTEAARRRADAFLKQHPKSVLASRVRRYSSP
jgi:outer membrane protein assembly factor BamD (BamD/ComL family)